MIYRILGAAILILAVVLVVFGHMTKLIVLVMIVLLVFLSVRYDNTQKARYTKRSQIDDD